MQSYDHYIALGDLISIDLYPSLDVGKDHGQLPIGAASLLFRNHDATWPESSGIDLASRFPGIEALNLTRDGDCTTDVLSTQLRTMRRQVPAGRSALITLTAGGNDLLVAFDHDRDGLAEAVIKIATNLERCVEEIHAHLPGATIIVTTVYDPTDGTGLLPGAAGELGELPVQFLDEYNDRIRQLANGRSILVADAQQHFQGRGRQAQEHERWYWAINPIEPNARGANEIRKLWLATLDGKPVAA
jgi:lysophospholipase L1-like esterase